MVHYGIGNLGHLFVISTFVFSLIALYCYVRAAGEHDLSKPWLLNGRIGFAVQAVAVVGIVCALFVIISNHYFEYNYAYSYSDRRLPTYYLISTFWNGQEGSFMLWIFWNAVIGVILIRTTRHWEAPVMAVLMLIQAFLASMILGVVIPGLDLKIGSSPFILLRDALPDPTFAANPDFVPRDGSGLNPLLQNYWMVIHPPTLFLGFALTGVPFSFCLAGLWQNKLTEWIRPALPWALFTGGVLGLGILMGGYWAYETLNFGGYWNWDPVENAVYVPWLILIAAIHTMITYRNSATALRSSMILVITVFVLILYSTFLTRSGILQDASVHSFTDLGLYDQLLIYLLIFLAGSTALLVYRWKKVPTSNTEVSTYSREFWILVGATVFCMMGFQVLLATSIPVWNKIVGMFGGESNLAPPADQVTFYSKVQIWFAVALAVLSAVGQFFWWKKMDKSRLRKDLFYPLLIALVLMAIVLESIVLTEGGIQSVGYIFLLFGGLFTIVANAKIFISVIRSSPRLSGGAVAHMGIGLMLLGILFSAGYSRTVSLNNTGMLISRELSEDFNRENLLLFVNEPRSMAGYDLVYLGEQLEPRFKSGLVDKGDVVSTSSPYEVVARKDIRFDDRQLFTAGDTFEIRPENTYYKIEFSKNGSRRFELYPRVQINQQMGGFVPSPDIRRFMFRDIYTHVTAPMSPEAKSDWSEVHEEKVKLRTPFYVNDYVAGMEEITRIYDVPGTMLDSGDVAVKALIRVRGERKDYFAEPIFLIKDQSPGVIADEIGDLGLRFTLMNIHPSTDEFTLGVQTRQKDWVVIKAVEKPYINILWLGTGLLLTGFGIAISRRVREVRKMRDKA